MGVVFFKALCDAGTPGNVYPGSVGVGGRGGASLDVVDFIAFRMPPGPILIVLGLRLESTFDNCFFMFYPLLGAFSEPTLTVVFKVPVAIAFAMAASLSGLSGI